MPRVWLDDEFHSHPKVIAAGLEGAGLYARALSYCGAYLTDGFVPGEWVEVITNRRKQTVKTLTEVGLWKPVKGGFRIPDYLEHNDSKAEVLKYRAERSRSGKKGARRRWGGGKNAPPLFEDDGESDSNSHSSSHGSSDSSSDSSSHSNSHSSPAREESDSSAMARDRAANTNTTTNTRESSSSGGRDLSVGQPPEEEEAENLVTYEEWLELEAQREREDEARARESGARA